MSVDVVYQGLTIARGAATKKVTARELFIETDGPMPVATALTVSHGRHSLTGQVSRVVEGVGAGMVIVPTAGDLPGWVTHLEQPQVETVVIEAELEDEAPQKSAPPAPAPAAAPEPVVQAAPPAPAPVIEMTAELPPSAATPDSPTESTVEFAIPTEDGGDSADKKANRGKKKSSNRRR